MTYARATGGFGEALKVVGGSDAPDPDVAPLSVPQRNAVGAFVEHDMPVCTGTLIAPRVVLTAAHCGIAPGMYFVVGDDAADPYAVARVTAVERHPGYSTGLLSAVSPSGTHDHLIAYLDRALPDTQPLDVGAPPRVDQPVQTVGYGRTVPGVSGNTEKWWLVESVGGVTPVEFRVTGSSRQGDEHGLCMGDSGGPAIVMRGSTPEVVGTVSHGDRSCVGADFFAVPDRAWVVNKTQATPPPAGVSRAWIGWGLGVLLVGAAVGTVWKRRR